VVVYGGQSIGLQFKELERGDRPALPQQVSSVDSSCSGVDIIVATPGRLVDMLERNRVSLEAIQVPRLQLDTL
jgi:superfamily II DNA/RNA helicase